MEHPFHLVNSVTCSRPDARIDDDGKSASDYVRQALPLGDGESLAVALGDRAIRIHARDGLALQAELRGQEAPLTQLACSKLDAAAVYSTSSDGRVRCWDVRTPSRPASAFAAGSEGIEAWCLVLGLDDWLCAVGVGSSVAFFDRRRDAARVGEYASCHTDDVTQLVFRPGHPTQLLTASEDGTMCMLDTGVADEEEALLCVLNAECPVRRVGFFGPGWEGVHCCTGSEGLSLWHAPSGQRVADFKETREVARKWGCPVDYLVGCDYDSYSTRLRLVAGSFDGQLLLAEVTPERLSPFAVLQSGHTDQVRDFVWQGGDLITGGEDGCLCCWRSDGGIGSGAGAGDDLQACGLFLWRRDGTVDATILVHSPSLMQCAALLITCLKGRVGQ